MEQAATVGGTLDRMIEVVIGLGLPGVIILALAFAVLKLYNRNQELHSTLYTIGREAVRSNEAMTAAINQLTASLSRSRE